MNSVIEDKAKLFDLINEKPCFISFFTGENGNGYALREVLRIEGRHYDKKVERAAEKKARQLGANSWIVFKPIGTPTSVYYEGEDARLAGLESK